MFTEHLACRFAHRIICVSRSLREKAITLGLTSTDRLMDVLALPSHREGFGSVVLEAYDAGIPVVAARATGLVDAVADGETGLLFPIVM